MSASADAHGSSKLTPSLTAADSSLDPAGDNPQGASAPLSRREFIENAAYKVAAEPPPKPIPGVWGILTAINANAISRKQGLDIFLNENVHCIGRLVKDTQCQIDSPLVSSKHCRIFRESSGEFYLEDTSLFGTFLNWMELGHNKIVKIHHGDIISLESAPDDDHSFAFVFREVLNVSPASDDNKVSKRKSNEIGPQKKKLKAIGLGAPEVPISLDDFLSMQQSNKELREQLMKQVRINADLICENRESVERHDKEMKGLKKTLADSYLHQIKEFKDTIDKKQKELAELTKLSAQQKQEMGDLNSRLKASVQSCTEAGEIMKGQAATVAELKSRLEEEPEQQREEHEKAAADLKEAVQRAQSEALVELKQWSDAALRREKGTQEILAKLQELEEESCALLENMRSKSEDTRRNLVTSENKVRQLEAQIHEEQQVSAKGKFKVKNLEHEVRRLAKDLENEKEKTMASGQNLKDADDTDAENGDSIRTRHRILPLWAKYEANVGYRSIRLSHLLPGVSSRVSETPSHELKREETTSS